MAIMGWTIVLLLHILWSVIIRPVISGLAPGKQSAEQPEKRKSPARLVLADDGEVVDIMERDAEQYHATMS
jgi:hypothetical protein